MAAVLLALIAMVQAGPREFTSWPDEHPLAVAETLPIPTDPGACLERQDNRQALAQVFQGLGLASSPRAPQNGQTILLVSEPEPVQDRLFYHYLSIGSALCESGPCLSIYAARIELPVTAEGQPLPQQALNDPDRTTVALLDAAREVARRCGHVPEREDG